MIEVYTIIYVHNNKSCWGSAELPGADFYFFFPPVLPPREPIPAAVKTNKAISEFNLGIIGSIAWQQGS